MAAETTDAVTRLLAAVERLNEPECWDEDEMPMCLYCGGGLSPRDVISHEDDCPWLVAQEAAAALRADIAAGTIVVIDGRYAAEAIPSEASS